MSGRCMPGSPRPSGSVRAGLAAVVAAVTRLLRAGTTGRDGAAASAGQPPVATTDPDGQASVRLGGRTPRLLLAGDPDAWPAVIDRVLGDRRPLVLVVNSQEVDGDDIAWLWDVEFDKLAGREVLVTGERALDLGIRLRYAGVAYTLADDVETAVRSASGGTPEIIACSSAFDDLFARGGAR